MQKKSKVIRFIWFIWHEKGNFALSCQIKKHLAWKPTGKTPSKTAQRDFFSLSCHMPDMPDVFKTFCVKRWGGDIQPYPSTLCISPPIPPGAKSWTQ